MNVIENKEVMMGACRLRGRLVIPDCSSGLVLFAHGAGSSRISTANQYLAQSLHDAGIGTLLFDLLRTSENQDRHKVFDIDLLAERLQDASQWVKEQPEVAHLGLGYFGSGTGAAAVIVAAAEHPDSVAAIVLRNGWLHLASDHLTRVEAPTLLVVGSRDEPAVEINREAMTHLRCQKKLTVLRGVHDISSDPHALEQVAGMSRDWFLSHLGKDVQRDHEPRGPNQHGP